LNDVFPLKNNIIEISKELGCAFGVVGKILRMRI
jgi:hypothetical protein